MHTERAGLLAALLLLLAGACGDYEAYGDTCGRAERQIAECLDPYCDGNDGAFCSCYVEGRHLTRDPGPYTAGPCECEDGTYWEEIEWLCEGLDTRTVLDCGGLRESIERLEADRECP